MEGQVPADLWALGSTWAPVHPRPPESLALVQLPQHLGAGRQPCPLPPLLVTVCEAISRVIGPRSHPPWPGAAHSPAPPSHSSPALIGAHRGQQLLHCRPLLALCHRRPPCFTPPPGGQRTS
uniref:Uncharacterized protein n=1 Tax=Myotis myotis TaxID=51298 RepID=A0A7J7ZXP8_MYOMY|nr:hypothetical protein mMyoMyo1_009731 [Myotis myotis]